MDRRIVFPGMTTWDGRPELALLAEKEEDRFTQLLCELLRSKEVMRGFLHLCGGGFEERAAHLRPSTQVTIPEGRLDLALHGPDTYLLVEAKVGAWLHDGQLVPYAAELLAWAGRNPGGQSRLLLLAPADTLAGLQETAAAQLRGTGYTQPPCCISWEQIAALCGGLVRDGVQPPELRVHLATFKALIERRLGPEEEPFASEELALLANPLTGRAMRRTVVILRKLIAALRTDDPDFKPSIKDSTSLSWQGFNLYLKGRWWWLGLWPTVWSTVGRSPLYLELPGMTEVMRAGIPAHLPAPVPYHTPQGDGFVVPLPLAPAMPLDEIARNLASIVRAYLTQVPASGVNKRPHEERDPDDLTPS
jgi:hypothetical protein